MKGNIPSFGPTGGLGSLFFEFGRVLLLSQDAFLEESDQERQRSPAFFIMVVYDFYASL